MSGVGELIISCDVSQDSCETAKTVFAQLHEKNLAATWVVSQPDDSELVAWVNGYSTRDEIAVAVGQENPNQSFSRRDFARDLESVAKAAKRGIKISTLVPPASYTYQHADLAIKHGISAVRRPVPPDDETTVVPRRGRFGLWTIPSSMCLSGAPSWFGRFGGIQQLRRAIDRAIVLGGVCHVVVDISAQSGANMSHVQRGLDRLIEHAQDRGAQDLLRCVTIHEAVSQRIEAERNQPAHSILREAA